MEGGDFILRKTEIIETRFSICLSTYLLIDQSID